MNRYRDDEDSNIERYFAVIDMERDFLHDIFYRVNLIESNINDLARLTQLIEPLHDGMLAPLPDIRKLFPWKRMIVNCRTCRNFD